MAMNGTMMIVSGLDGGIVSLMTITTVHVRLQYRIRRTEPHPQVLPLVLPSLR